MKINFIDLNAQYDSIHEEIDKALAGVISHASYILGPAVSEFEAAFAKFCGCQYAVGVNSGTTALFLTLKALGIGAGDEVITAANTFIATAAAIVYTGAEPVLVDIDPATGNIDPELLEAAISSRTRAIMPVHLYGLMADMNEINALAKRHNLAMIEDACQAHGAKLEGHPAGSFGRAGCFSFYPGKNLGAYGEGGAIVTSDPELYRTLRLLRDHGSEKKYYHDVVGYNARMEGIQGAVLGVKLRHLENWNEKRNRIANRYRRGLQGLPLITPQEFDGFYHVYHLFVIETEERDRLQSYLSEQGITTLIHYPIPIHRQKAFAGASLATGQYHVTERLADRILSLPIYAEMSDEQVDYVIQKIREFFGR